MNPPEVARLPAFHRIANLDRAGARKLPDSGGIIGFRDRDFANGGIHAA
jgi:hypothetical protein